jgi:DNA/RNA endonuclease G (NUC1)
MLKKWFATLPSLPHFTFQENCLMRKFVFFAFGVALLTISQFTTNRTSAQKVEMVSPHLVISQFQGGGAVAEDEFVEIHNTSDSPIDLNGYRLVYRSQTGQSDVLNPFAAWSTSTIIPAGGFYLIATPSYDGPVPADRTYTPSSCSCSMSATNGGLAIRQGANDTGTVIDSVAWGTVSNGLNVGTATSAPGVNNSKSRKQNGCQDTDNNANDFDTVVPSAPRNSSSTPVQCAGSGTNLFASLSANPTTVAPGGNTLLTVTVIPATTPPSTSVTVAANLQSIGGASSQTFYDDGTHGDTSSGDNVFSFQATVAQGTSGGTATVAGAAADGQGRTAPVQFNLTINAPLSNEDPLVLGNPTNATTDAANQNNYLIQRAAYSLSYNRANATPNWVAWRLDNSSIGSFNNGDFAPDTSLPSGWYQVLPEDYGEPVYDRGHMCPSGDRTSSQALNSQTFLMTNIIPQHPDNNQGTWNDFENYCRTLANQGNELYIISGPYGNIGTIGSTQQNRIVVPSKTWKVVLVLPNGSNDLQRVGRSTRAFGIVMDNVAQSRSTPWRNFRVTVNAVENLTGYDFFSNVPRAMQELIEKKRDRL